MAPRMDQISLNATALAASERFRRIHRRLVRLRSRPQHVVTGHPLLDLVLAAGRDALRSAGLGWRPEGDLSVTLGNGEAVQLELIGFKRVDLKVNPHRLLPQAAALGDRMAANDELSVVWNGVRSLVRLFAGYYDLCPYDGARHDRLVNEACWGAFRTHYPSGRERQVAASIVSLFERSIVSYRLTRLEGADFVYGLALERILNQHPPHLFSSLFQRSQSVLFPKEWGEAFAICPLIPEPTADALLTDALFIIFRARVRMVRGHLRLRGRIRCPISWEWGRSVQRLAELLAPYLEQQGGANSQGIPFASAGQGDERTQMSLPGGGLAACDPGDMANPFAGTDGQDLPGSPQGYSGGGMLPGRGRGRGIRYDFEQLDEHYVRQAKSLEVRDESEEGAEEEPEMLPVGFLDYAPASLRDLASGQIDWFRTRCSQPGEQDPSGLRLFRLSEPLEIPADAFDPVSRDVPNLLLVVDSSGSMKFNPSASGASRGKYDVVLMACWGLFRFLKERSLDDRVWVNALNFSGATRSSGWHRGNEVTPVKRVLAAYEGGGTTLNVSAVRTARDTCPGHFLLLAMTDGQLGNTPQAIDELRRTSEAGNRVALLHIGAPNLFTEGVRRLHGCVHIVPDAQALVGLSLDVARANYTVSSHRSGST